MRFRRPAPSQPTADAARPATPSGARLPSIWVGTYRSAQEWADDTEHRSAVLGVFDGVDDKMMSSRHPFDIRAWCASCQSPQTMAVAWNFGQVSPDGSVHAAWTETACCRTCGLVSRQRALIDRLRRLGGDTPPDGSAGPAVYLAERLTPAHSVYEQRYPSLVTSEFLGDEHPGGSMHRHESGIEIRHEDMTALSFGDASFDLVVTQDVFEHIPDFPQAFAECRRVLRADGRMLFTIPFFPDRPTTLVRATVGHDGEISHLHPPEIHGNPVGDGSLCFQHFGWDLLDALRSAGFEDAAAHMYWGPWAGHLGAPMFVFEASAS